jgi:hypothetical protein
MAAETPDLHAAYPPLSPERIDRVAHHGERLRTVPQDPHRLDDGNQRSTTTTKSTFVINVDP